MTKVDQIKRRACVGTSRLSKTALLGLLRDTSSYQFFYNMDSDTWNIDSFNPNTGEVCVTITTPSGNRTISITVSATGVEVVETKFR